MLTEYGFNANSKEFVTISTEIVSIIGYVNIIYENALYLGNLVFYVFVF
jgi:hypothetical protein